MLGRYDRAMRARQPVGRLTLLQQAIAAIRRNNGTLFYVPQNALGDGAPNLLSAPEDFSSASWVKADGLTLTSGFPAPDGTNAAFRITSTAGTYRFIYFAYPSTAGLPLVLSFRVRAASGTGRTFRLAHGDSGSTYSEVFTATNVFQTFSVPFTSSATEFVAITDAASGAGSVGFDLEIFGAKLEQGSTATAYTPQSVLRTRGAFIDSAGVSPVTNIADVIGRMTDRTGGSAVATQPTTANKPTVRRVPKRLGPNLVSNGDGSSLTGWTGSTGYSVASGTFKCSGATAEPILQQNVGVQQGKTYQVTFTQSGRTAGNSYLVLGGTQPAGTPSLIANQTYSFVLTATTTAGTLVFSTPSGTYDGSFDNISVQEVLEWQYAMSFDGSNDSLTTNITTGNEGWVCAGVTFGGAVGANETVFASGAGSATQKGVWLLRNSTARALRMGVGNGTALTMDTVTALPLLNVPRVVEGGWDASTVIVGVDGITSSKAKAGDVTAPGTALIGAFLGGILPLQGPMSAIVNCPVLPSAADRAIIRKWIGSLQGQTL